ncbi:Uncharacterised protein [Klebsiella pneumoniae]|nr:Uncharacterised protein [Klebsiella pneumoniae]
MQRNQGFKAVVKGVVGVQFQFYCLGPHTQYQVFAGYDPRL